MGNTSAYRIHQVRDLPFFRLKTKEEDPTFETQ
jgi:hypothetical protein